MERLKKTFSEKNIANFHVRTELVNFRDVQHRSSKAKGHPCKKMMLKSMRMTTMKFPPMSVRGDVVYQHLEEPRFPTQMMKHS